MSRVNCCEHPCPFNLARLDGDTGTYEWMRPIRFAGWRDLYPSAVTTVIPAVREVRYATATDKLWLVVGGANAIETAGAVSYRLMIADPETGNALLAVANVWPALLVPTDSDQHIAYSMGVLSDGRAVVLSTDSEWTSGTHPDIYAYVVAADGLSWERFLVASAGTVTSIVLAAGGDTIAVTVDGTDTTLYTAAGDVIWTSAVGGYAAAIGADGAVLQAPQPSFKAATFKAADGTLQDTLSGSTTTLGYFPGQTAGTGYVVGDWDESEVILTDSALSPVTTLTGVQAPALAGSSTAIAVAKYGAAQVAKYSSGGSLLWTENSSTVVTGMAIGPDGDVYYSCLATTRLTADDVLNPW